MQSTQPEFEIVDSKKNKVILYDNYRFVVNKKTQHTVYLRCFEKCGVTLHLNAEVTAIKKYPGLPPHDHHEEKIREEKFRQKLKKKFTKTLQNIYNEEVEKTTDRVYPEYRTVKSSLYRARAKKCLQFQGPSEICRFVVHGKKP